MNLPRTALAVAAALLATAPQAAQRVFVASTGNDASSCVLPAPCRSFTRAMAEVDAGGEVVALDAAGYGAVVVTKSVTITANPGFYAGISVSTGHAIELSGPIDVVLRGLNLNAVGVGTGALSGIHVTNANSLTVENCIVSNFPLVGLNSVFSSKSRLRITDSTFRGNGIYGILVGGGSTATIDNVRLSGNASAGLIVLNSGEHGPAEAIVTNSDASANLEGFRADGGRLSIRASTAASNAAGVVSVGGGHLSIARSSVIGNIDGFYNADSTFESYGDNVLRYNIIPTTGTITVVPGE